jgi:hypothetical protein
LFYMTCQSHPSPLAQSIYTWRRVTLWSPSLWSFLRPLVTSSPNIRKLHGHFLPNHFSFIVYLCPNHSMLYSQATERVISEPMRKIDCGFDAQENNRNRERERERERDCIPNTIFFL